jgi:hypothetical protein
MRLEQSNRSDNDDSNNPALDDLAEHYIDTSKFRFDSPGLVSRH